MVNFEVSFLEAENGWCIFLKKIFYVFIVTENFMQLRIKATVIGLQLYRYYYIWMDKFFDICKFLIILVIRIFVTDAGLEGGCL